MKNSTGILNTFTSLILLSWYPVVLMWTIWGNSICIRVTQEKVPESTLSFYYTVFAVNQGTCELTGPELWSQLRWYKSGIITSDLRQCINEITASSSPKNFIRLVLMYQNEKKNWAPDCSVPLILIYILWRVHIAVLQMIWWSPPSLCCYTTESHSCSKELNIKKIIMHVQQKREF